MTSDNYRALANNMYGAGADGVSSFNFQEQYTGNLIGGFPGELALLRELKDPEAIKARRRTYLFRVDARRGGLPRRARHGFRRAP